MQMKTSQLARKVPHILAIFWVIKVLTTAMGEAASDFSVKAINPVAAVGLGALVFVVALSIQIRIKRYIAAVYWFTVAMVAVFGTMAADVLHIQFGVPYAVSTCIFAVTLALIFFLWHAVEGTLSIHSINTRRRELFYWATVLATFALGTAAGDLAATTLHLGYLLAGIMFAVIMLVPIVAYYGFKASEIVTFWLAYIVTRPLGASFADWAGKPKDIGGLGMGDGTVALILTILIICLVSYLQTSQVDIEKA
jgi:uncharacterized membrane-anchored protein